MNKVVVAAMVAAVTFGSEAAGQDGVPGLGKILSYQLDISRCKVPKTETVYRIVDILSSLGYNQFQLYMEHTFAYPQHEVVWREASPMTPDEIRRLDDYCATRGIELVPNQNSFGHLEAWLKLPEYNALAECPEGGARAKSGFVFAFPRCLCPIDPRSERLIAGLYDELFPCFRSKYVNIDNAVTAGGRHGADGVMVADWGDGGHPNPWLTSVPGIVYAAHRVKGVRLSRTELAAKLDVVLGCRCGEALLAYGDVYRKCRGRMGNSTELYYLLREGKDYRRRPDVTDETLAAALAQARYAKSLADLAGAPEWVRDDFAMLDLLVRAVEVRIADPTRPNLRAQFEPEYRRLWLKQNRLGGLGESLNQLFGIYL